MKSTACMLEGRTESKPPPAKPLDGSAWGEWIGKGRTQDKRRLALFLSGFKGLSLMAVVAAAAYWSSLLPYDGMARYSVAVVALAAAFLAFRGRQYVAASVFGVIACVCSPLASTFSPTGGWLRTAMAVLAILLAASFAGVEKKKAQND